MREAVNELSVKFVKILNFDTMANQLNIGNLKLI